MARALQTLEFGLPRFTLRDADGFAEFTIARSAAARLSRPARVTRLLAAALQSVEGIAVTTTLVRRLSSGTREWLLQKIASLFRPREDWFEAECVHCGARYDFPLDIAALAAKPEGSGFPIVEVGTSLGQRRFEVPNGADEEAFAVAGGDEPRRRFAALCGLADDADAEAHLFLDTDLDAIDSALDAVAPQPADRSATSCPSCGRDTLAAIEPLSFAFPSELALLGEVHRIAARYHWSEDAILALPTRRRRQYLAMIRTDGRGQRPGRYA